MSTPNTEIHLYSGAIGVSTGQSVWQGTGRVYLDWLPSPTIKFTVDVEEISDPLFHGEVRLSLEGYESEIKGQLTTIRLSGGIPDRPTVVQGFIENGEGHNRGHPLSRIDFDLANFPDYIGQWIKVGGSTARAGRASLVSADWTLILDAVDRQPHISADPAGDGGYIITHAARLVRTDRQTFTTADARAVLENLYWFFSFCRGKPCAPVLPRGFDVQAELVWSEWASVSIAPMSSRSASGWLNRKNTSGLDGVFPAFFSKVQEPVWTKPLKLAIYWYLEAGAVGNDSCLILAQAAFELLAWNVLVKGSPAMSRTAFGKRGGASRNLRKLLDDARIPTAIPTSLTSLNDLASTSGWADGPDALVEVRNALVHPTKDSNERDIDNLDAFSLFHASILSLWYLELLLLHVIGYSGEYSNRTVMTGFRGSEVEPTPWAV